MSKLFFKKLNLKAFLAFNKGLCLFCDFKELKRSKFKYLIIQLNTKIYHKFLITLTE